jgi:hypothetical protein
MNTNTSTEVVKMVDELHKFGAITIGAAVCLNEGAESLHFAQCQPSY